MKFAAVTFLSCVTPQVALAFSVGTPFVRQSKPFLTQVALSDEPKVVYGGNTWNPDDGKMRSTDTGDFYPEDYEAQVEFTDGMMGSQGKVSGEGRPELPGMENLGEDAVMMGGIEEHDEIPAGMEFIPMSVPDGEVNMRAAASGNAVELKLEVAPVCMTFEDFYASFSANSHPSFSVSPVAGRMDRRGGEISEFVIRCDPRGQAGTFEGDLVINLPEDNSKICYKVTAEVF